MRLILASASPRRRELLTRLGLPFEVRPSAIEEPVAPGVPAVLLTPALARAKAGEIVGQVRAAREAPAIVLGADTLVVLEGRLLGKPVSRDDARAMLAALGGRSHEVVTAVVVVETMTGRAREAVVTSRVVMRPYTAPEIEAYVATGESDDKAGGYAVQGERGRLVARVEGCYTNVVGLPIRTTARLLREFGLAPADPAPCPAS